MKNLNKLQRQMLEFLRTLPHDGHGRIYQSDLSKLDGRPLRALQVRGFLTYAGDGKYFIARGSHDQDH